MNQIPNDIELRMLIDILRKKAEGLEIILTISENQEVLLEQPSGSERVSMFKEMAAEKQKHIDNVLQCDNVFQAMYDSIKEEVESNIKTYKDYLVVMQNLIEHILQIDIKIRTQEAKNRDILQKQLPAAAPLIKKENVAVTDASKKRLLSQYKQYGKP